MALLVRALGKSEIWIRDFSSGVYRSVPSADAAGIFWSPDNSSIAFFDQGYLRKMDIASGPVLKICETHNPRGGSWASTDVILFANDGEGIYQVAATGGTPVSVLMPDKTAGERSVDWPFFLPDERHFLYLSQTIPGAVWVADLKTGEKNAWCSLVMARSLPAAAFSSSTMAI